VRESLQAAFGDGPVVVIPGKRYKAVVAVLKHMPSFIRSGLQMRYSKARV